MFISYTKLMKHGIEGVAFDLDGTLYPNINFYVMLLPFIIKEWRLLSAFGEARKIIRKNQETAPLPQGDFYEYQAEITGRLLSIETKQIKNDIEEKIYRGWEPLFKKVKLFSHADETLDALRKAGYKLGILSDFPLMAKLENLKIDGYWDAVLSSEEVNALKPHPVSFEKLAREMSLPCEKILYVGNSYPYDVVGAAGTGMKTAWIKGVFKSAGSKNNPKPDFIFNNYRQLLKFMVN